MQLAHFFILLAVYSQLACALRERRQPSACADVSTIPESCRSLLDRSLRDTAFGDSSGFVESYCNDTCAQPLYDYFRECDKVSGFSNATRFDFFCSSNSTGGLCIPALFANLSFIYECTLESGACGDECKTTLTTTRDSLGCCVYSYYAVVAGPTVAAAIYSRCGLGEQNLCDGGVTGAPLQFFEAPEVDPRCEDLVDSVPEACRYLISSTYSNHVLGFLDIFCDDNCAPDVYQFTRQCDAITGEYNSTVIDFYCARNDAGQRCGDVVFDAYKSDKDPFEACYGDDDSSCPEACRSAITQAQTDLGCCLITFYQVVADSEVPDASLLFSLCGVEGGDTCVGHFSNEPIGPPPTGGDDDCQSLQATLPPQCQGFVSVDLLIGQAFVNQSTFLTDFCNSECGEAVYNYHLQCDRISGSNNTAEVDFLCSQNDDGAACAGVFSDPSVQAITFRPECKDLSDEFCSDECSSILQQPSRTWGCCLFTLGAVTNNITYAEGVADQCKQPGNSNLCIGAFSGKPVAADPGDDKDGDDKDGDDKDGDDKDGTTTVVISSVLVIAILTLFNNY